MRSSPALHRARAHRRGGERALRRTLLAAALLLPLPLTVWAHAFWLVPFGPAAEPGQRVALDLRIGPRWPGESTPRSPDFIADFRVIDAQGSREVAGREGGVPVGHFEARAPGAAIVVMQTTPSTLTLPGDEFRRYLHEEGLDNALQFRADLDIADSPAREDFSRAAKTLVVVGGDTTGFDRALGLPMELVPLTDPVAYRAGAPFRARLLLAGHAAPNTRVAALPQDHPDRIVEGRTGDDGEVALNLPRAGLWTLYAVHIRHARHSSADWESIWASLTLSVGAAP